MTVKGSLAPVGRQVKGYNDARFCCPHNCKVERVSDTKTIVLNTAINTIQRDGYAALSMRQLATDCDIKLASLQYHFNTWDALIEAIAAHIVEEYASHWNGDSEAFKTVSLSMFVDFILSDIERLESSRMWPQLRAWGLVEPRMKDMLAGIYSHYMKYLTHKFTQLGCEDPKLEALTMMITLEGASIFVGKGSTYHRQLKRVKMQVLENLEHRFGKEALA
jgi:AcrR family transcriptional regulator